MWSGANSIKFLKSFLKNIITASHWYFHAKLKVLHSPGTLWELFKTLLHISQCVGANSITRAKKQKKVEKSARKARQKILQC